MSSSASRVSRAGESCVEDSASDRIGSADGSNVWTIGGSICVGRSRRTVSIFDRMSCAAWSLLRRNSNSMMIWLTPSSETDVMRSTSSTGLNASSSRRVTSRSTVSGEAPG